MFFHCLTNNLNTNQALTFLSFAVQLSMWSTTGRLVVTLAHTCKSAQNRHVINFLLSRGCQDNPRQTPWPPLQPVWSQGLFHPCGQTGPESDRLAGTWTFSDSGHNLPSNGCNSKMLGCGLETRTRGYLHRDIMALCDFIAERSKAYCCY